MEIKELKTDFGMPRQWMLSKVEDNTMSMLIHSCRNSTPMIISGIEQEVIVEFFEIGSSGNIAKAVELVKYEQPTELKSTQILNQPPPVASMAHYKGDNRLWTPEQMCAKALADNPNCKSAFIIMVDKDDDFFFQHYASNLSMEQLVALMEYQKAMFMRDIV